MRISLNLATRPFTDLGPALKRLRIALGVLASLAILLALGLHALHQRAVLAREREQAIEARITTIHQERQSYQRLMLQPANVQLMLQIDALNKLFDLKTFSWTLAMEDLETVLPAGVQVSTLEPIRDLKSGQISLRLRVVGPRDKAVELVRNLEHSRHFLLPRIVGENSEASGGPNERLMPVSASSPVDFDLLANYNPAAPPDPRPRRTPTAAPPPTSMPANRFVRPAQPLPLPLTGQSRPPYLNPQLAPRLRVNALPLPHPAHPSGGVSPYSTYHSASGGPQ